jgi:NAD(P)-dependent dehydrogenase (short-subunit alcohol dehydrogenase family)
VDALARFLSARPMPAAIVAGVASRSGLAAIRVLARAGAPVVALDHRSDALGFRSRFAFSALTPHPLRDRERFLAFARALGERLGRPAPVFPVTGEYAEAFAAVADRLPGRFLVASSWRGMGVGAAADESLRVEYWALLGADVRAAPVDRSGGRVGLAGVDPGPAIAAAVRRVRGRRR